MQAHNLSHLSRELKSVPSPSWDGVRLSKDAVFSMNNPHTYVPENLRDGLIRYLEHGIPNGSFVTAVLDNNLILAVQNAHTTSALHICSIVRWLWAHAPSDAWGSESNRMGWMDARRRDAGL